MAPLQVKSSSPSQTSHSMLVRETVRLSATLASPDSSADSEFPCPSPSLFGGEVLCWEIHDGKRYKYLGNRNLLEPIGLKSSHNALQDVITFVKSCMVPEGYPDSVTSSYRPYMQWRALKYFFGGAMGVFTTRSLLHSVGVSVNGATSSAIAVNWVLKDGAGRIGKMLFARQGKKFDCYLKQLRFSGDLLMELGAGVELATMAAPHLFLPFACVANVAKNVAAVTSTSTRSHIYKAFARGENIGDVTAKGECISNVADLLGTGLSIFLSKRNPSLVTTFAVLSFGYVFCSYREVKSVVLNSLNRSRFDIAVESFLKTGQVPLLQEGNSKEIIFPVPWHKKREIVLGARVNEAFEDLNNFVSVRQLFEKERYMINFNPRKGRVYALLRENSNSDDVLRAAFHAHLLLHIICNSKKFAPSKQPSGASMLEKSDSATRLPLLSTNDAQAEIAESCKHVSLLYESFKKHTKEKGWTMSESLLSPGNTRLCV
eukprot:TRINITY_DN14477_c0_g1_i1.p1 TRINITY_DN14477_c0_g1~~TRINITY_DN14477_c0_g1_i1.p1  ORF type:complete len:487 (-),score=87.04 TRINITY_DN14477_c0_g1_i1:368-1828(-)